MQRIKNFWNNLTPLKRRAIVLVGVSLVVGFFLSGRSVSREVVSPSVWQTFAVAGDHPFRIQMPTYPRHVVHDTSLPSIGMIAKTGIYISEDIDGGIYALRVTSYPENVMQKSRDAILKAEGDALLPNLEGFTLDVSPSGDGVAFLARRYDDGSWVSGRVIVAGNSVYTFSLVARPSPTFDAELIRFIASFEL